MGAGLIIIWCVLRRACHVGAEATNRRLESEVATAIKRQKADLLSCARAYQSLECHTDSIVVINRIRTT